MLVSEMREKFVERSGQTADGLEESQIEDYLTRAYRFTIPGVLTGELVEKEWEYDLKANAEVATLPWYIHSLKESAWRENTRIRLYYDYTTFWRDFIPDNVTPGQPTGILIYGRQLTFRPIPDRDFTIRFPSRQYPQERLNGDAGPGILVEVKNDNRAQAIICAACIDFFADTNQIDKQASMAGMFDMYMDMLRTQSMARPRGHYRIRSF